MPKKLCHCISTSGEAMTGVYEALDYFAKQGLQVALATSSNHVVINAVFERLQLWDKFSVVYEVKWLNDARVS